MGDFNALIVSLYPVTTQQWSVILNQNTLRLVVTVATFAISSVQRGMRSSVISTGFIQSRASDMAVNTFRLVRDDQGSNPAG